MPFVPSLGLSVLIHILVIWFYKLPQFIGGKYARGAVLKLSMSATGFLGVLTAGAISVLIMSGAISLVHTSVTEEHSTILFVGRQYTELAERFRERNSTIANSEANMILAGSESVGQVLGQKMIDCEQVFETLAGSYGWSLVNYLAMHGYKYSFPDREKLASEFGIMDYRGTRQQNESLLREFFIKYEGLPATSSPVCKT